MRRGTFAVKPDVLSDVAWPVPTDITATLLFVAIADVLLLGTPTNLAPLRALFALPVVLFVPGYVAVASLFPRRHSSDPRSDSGSRSADSGISNVGRRARLRTRSITWGERLALSFGLSIALVPLLALVIAPIGGSLSLEPVLAGLNAFVVIGVVAGTARRNRLPPEERLRVSYGRSAHAVRESFFGGQGRVDGALSLLLAVSVLVAVGTLGFALFAPQQGEAYTGATLLAENDAGELVASGFPTEFTQGEGEELVLRIDNNEGVETTYQIVVELQRLETSGESVRVTAEETVHRESGTVGAGETWLAPHTIEPSMAGEDLRLAYHVYRGDAPTNPDEDSAYRNLYLWIDVSEPNGQT